MKKYKYILSRFHERKNQVAVILLALLHFTASGSFSQSQLLTYKVIRNGAEAGWVKLNRNTNGSTSVISMASEIKVKIIFPVTVTSNEYAESGNGKLIHSYVFRKINNNIKVDKHTRLKENIYESENFSRKEKLRLIPVCFNVLDLYFREPSDFKEAYSSSYQTNLQIENKQPHIYRLMLPDGSINEYHYNKNGNCVKVRVNQNLYSADFILLH